MFRKLFRKKLAPVILDADASIHKDGKLMETFGIRIYDGSVWPLASIGDSYPSVGSYTFSTTEDNQDQITLFFYRGKDRMAGNCIFLGECRMRGFKLSPANEPLVRLHFKIEENKIELWAEDEKDRNDISITIVKRLDGGTIH